MPESSLVSGSRPLHSLNVCVHVPAQKTTIRPFRTLLAASRRLL